MPGFQIIIWEGRKGPAGSGGMQNTGYGENILRMRPEGKRRRKDGFIDQGCGTDIP